MNTDTLIASARSGNVIGGGDWCKNRLIPDLIRSIDSGKPWRLEALMLRALGIMC